MIDTRISTVDRIKAIQRARGMTMAALAEQAEIPYTTLQQYMAGKTRLPAAALASIATALDVSADWLLFGKPASLDLEKLAKALQAHDDLRQVSGDKLSSKDYAKIFAKSYDDWNRPEPLTIMEGELAKRGIKLVVQKKSEGGKT